MVRIDTRSDGHDVVVRRTADVHGTRTAGNRIAGWMDTNDAHGMPDEIARQCSMARRATDAPSALIAVDDAC
jgi:hypothetical protein